MAMGLFMAISAISAVASPDERHEGRKGAETERHDSKIYGTIKSMPDGKIGVWNVNGREVKVTKNTLIKEKYGRVEVGAYVEVEGDTVENTLNAYKIEVKRGSGEERSHSRDKR